MNKISFESPVDLITDDELIYNAIKHQYQITAEAIMNETGLSIVIEEGSEENATLQLKRISKLIYAWIYSQIDTSDKPVVEFRISRDTNLAEALKEAMLSLYESEVLTGAMAIYYEHGAITGLTGKEKLDAVMPTIVKDILRDSTLLKSRYNIRIPETVFRVGY